MVEVQVRTTVPIPNPQRAIGLISPLVGGFYFGGLVAGATRAAANAGHRVIAMQTFPTRPARERHPGEPLPGGPWSLDMLDGIVVVTRSMSAHRLSSVLDWGRPVVLVGADEVEDRTPIALSDNAGGARAAVDHLIEHGHTQIGFAGDLSQRDIRERFEGYRDALADHGIDVRREWFYETTGNHEPGGADAGDRFIAAGMPTTATIAATDRNAIGFARALRASDFVLPRDQALIGFDHTESGARLVPRLSTVDPHHDRVGELAVNLLLAQLRGGTVTVGAHRVPATLVVRDSCGCSAVGVVEGPSRSRVPAQGGSPTPGRTLVHGLARTGFAGPVSVPGGRFTEDETREAWLRAVLDPLENAADRGSAPSAVALLRLNDLTAALQPHPEALEQCISAVREVELELAGALPAGSRRLATLNRAATDILLALGRGCTRPSSARIGHLERTIDDQYEVDLHLLSEQGGSARMLTWLPRNVGGPACFGLWVGHDNACGDREIEIAGVQGRSAALARLLGQRMPASQFPPPALTRAEPIGGPVLTFVLPVTSPGSDWGLLAINGRVESQMTSSREKYHHWGALLAIALDQERLVEGLRTEATALRLSASTEHQLADQVRVQEERHAYLTRAAQHGTWDWDVSAGSVYFSPQWKQALGYDEADIGSSPAEWLDRVHPDDRRGLSALIAAQLGGARSPLECEHRVRAASGEYRWMKCRAVTVFDDAGCPSRLVGALVDVTPRKAEELALSRGALRDPQTGLATRALFLDRLGVAVARSHRSEPFDSAVVLLRTVAEGPAADPGARPPRDLVALLRRATPDGDSAARLAENEFALLLGAGFPGGPTSVGKVVAALRTGPRPVAIGVLESLRAADDAGDALLAAGLQLQRDQAEVARHVAASRPASSVLVNE